MKIALVTDSTCDIPRDLVADLNITVVPNMLIIDGESIPDDENFSRSDFYEQLPEMTSFPTTSTSSVGYYQGVYEKILNNGYDQILSIHCSKELSGIFNAASTASREFQEKILIVDSRQLSLGLGFQVLEAVEAISGGLSIEAVEEHLGKIRNKVRVVAMLDTLEFVRRSGRVSWARARVGGILNLKPFVEVVDGHVLSIGQVRTRKKGIKNLLEMMDTPTPMSRFAVLHTNAEEEARWMLDQLSPALPNDPLVVNATTVIGAHVGPQGLGFAALYTDEPIRK
jgi:DegV family protein with EDD domain